MPRYALLICVLLCNFCTTPALAKRVALVIGNSQYQNLSTLDNPSHDAAAVAEKLRTLQFDLIGENGSPTETALTDLDRNRFLRVIDKFTGVAQVRTSL